MTAPAAPVVYSAHYDGQNVTVRWRAVPTAATYNLDTDWFAVTGLTTNPDGWGQYIYYPAAERDPSMEVTLRAVNAGAEVSGYAPFVKVWLSDQTQNRQSRHDPFGGYDRRDL